VENIKTTFQKLIKEDLPRFILIMTQVGMGLLFFISVYLPFVKGPEIINTTVSMSEFPGSFIFEVILFISVPLFLYLILSQKENLSRKVILVQNIIALLTLGYGVLLYRVGFPESTSGAFGKHLEFVLLIGMWLAFLRPELVLSFIRRFVKQENSKTESNLNTVEETEQSF